MVLGGATGGSTGGVAFYGETQATVNTHTFNVQNSAQSRSGGGALQQPPTDFQCGQRHFGEWRTVGGIVSVRFRPPDVSTSYR